MYTVKYCPICKKNLPNPYFVLELFICCENPDEHRTQFIDTGITEEDFDAIDGFNSTNLDFLEAMIALKEKDPIEYELKMSQFRQQASQNSNMISQQDKSSEVHCPYCNSTNIKKISGTERTASIVLLGIFSKKINKSFKCNNCGGTF